MEFFSKEALYWLIGILIAFIVIYFIYKLLKLFVFYSVYKRRDTVVVREPETRNIEKEEFIKNIETFKEKNTTPVAYIQYGYIFSNSGVLRVYSSGTFKTLDVEVLYHYWSSMNNTKCNLLAEVENSKEKMTGKRRNKINFLVTSHQMCHVSSDGSVGQVNMEVSSAKKDLEMLISYLSNKDNKECNLKLAEKIETDMKKIEKDLKENV